MLRIALRNLLHDRLRLGAALAGVAFSVVLVTFQVGLLHRFLRDAGALVEGSRAPIWITSPKVTNFEFASILDERVYYQALAAPGVGKVERLVFVFARIRMPTGAYEGVQLVGLDISKGPSIPWAFSEGNVEMLREPDTIAVDDTDIEKLNRPRLGEILEVNDRRAKLVGLTHQHRSFISSPFVFTSIENSYRYASRVAWGGFTYLLVTPAPGADLEAVKKGLRKIPGIDVLDGSQLANRSRTYWIFRTGAGFAIGLSTLLGFIVGTVIVGQTIYSSTMDRLKEFGTLKAIGASNRHLYRLIITQALLYAAAGYALGMAASAGVARLSAGVGSPIIISPHLVAAMLAVTAAMCVFASFLSIARVTRIVPAMVFKS
jgi:putative ABC transport system permease protein